MKTIEKVYLIGLGAIGGAYGSKIMENLPDNLHIVVDKERAARYSKPGITVNGRVIPFRFVTPDSINETADLLIIAVKQHHLAGMLGNIRSLVGPDTIILSLLNGISSEEILGKEFGTGKLLHSFVVGTDAVRTATDIRFSNLGKIVFGDREGSGASSKVHSVRDFFDRTQVPYSIPEDIMRELWWKFMMNVGLNQVSAVLHAPYGVFSKEGPARELMFEASREVVNISVKAGIHLNEDDLKNYAAIISKISPEGKTSMCQDVEAGRKTEVEIFSGTVIELGRKYGVATPVNDALFKLLRAIEQMNGIF